MFRGVLLAVTLYDVPEPDPGVETVPIATFEEAEIALQRGPDGWALEWGMLHQWAEEREYTAFGYKGKQVRDNTHSHDLARCVEAFYENPGYAEVFNLGGGRANSVSILEAFAMAEERTGKAMRWTYDPTPRRGDHMCYISDLGRLRSRLPGWDITRSLDRIFDEIVESWSRRTA